VVAGDGPAGPHGHPAPGARSLFLQHLPVAVVAASLIGLVALAAVAALRRRRGRRDGRGPAGPGGDRGGVRGSRQGPPRLRHAGDATGPAGRRRVHDAVPHGGPPTIAILGLCGAGRARRRRRRPRPARRGHHRRPGRRVLARSPRWRCARCRCHGGRGTEPLAASALVKVAAARALGPLDLTVHAGELVALIGHNGRQVHAAAARRRPAGSLLGRADVCGQRPARSPPPRGLVRAGHPGALRGRRRGRAGRVRRPAARPRPAGRSVPRGRLARLGLRGRVTSCRASSAAPPPAPGAAVGVARPFSLLLLDEPFGPLDAGGAEVWWPPAPEHARRRGLVVSSHQPDLLQAATRTLSWRDASGARHRSRNRPQHRSGPGQEARGEPADHLSPRWLVSRLEDVPARSWSSGRSPGRRPSRTWSRPSWNRRTGWLRHAPGPARRRTPCRSDA